MKAICTLCNFVVEEKEEKNNQKTQGILTSSEFDQLPENWKCPGCSATKEFLQTCSCVALATSEIREITAHKCA